MNELATAPRHEIYRLIHKGLRAFMTDTLTAMGAMDPTDEAEVQAMLAQVRSLVAFTRGHLEHENEFLHPVMEAREPGSTQRTALDHEDHGHMFEDLLAAATAVEGSQGDERAEAAQVLYRRLAVFVGENLVHMDVEEGHNNAVLWRNYTDEELDAIHGNIVAAHTPEEMMFTLRWMVPAATPAERADLLSTVRASAPPPAFAAIMEMIGAHLKPADRAKLDAALSTPALAA